MISSRPGVGRLNCVHEYKYQLHLLYEAVSLFSPTSFSTGVNVEHNLIVLSINM